MNVPKSTSTFEYTNPHPKGIKGIGDCVFRAIAIATGKDWLTVYDELTALGRELYAPPNDTKVYSKYLDGIATTVEVQRDSRKLTAGQLAVQYPSATIVVRQANHLVTVRNGKVRDTWDSSYRKAYKAWVIK